MIIAIPTDENKENVCQSFARAPFFLLYDTVSSCKRYEENFAANAEDGAGVKASQAIVDSSVDVLITFRLGENSAAVLSAGDIKIFKAESDSLKENLDLFQNGKLNELTHFHGGYQGIK